MFHCLVALLYTTSKTAEQNMLALSNWYLDGLKQLIFNFHDYNSTLTFLYFICFYTCNYREIKRLIVG